MANLLYNNKFAAKAFLILPITTFLTGAILHLTIICVISGWITCLLLAHIYHKSATPKMDFFLTAFIFELILFYWLPASFEQFLGFSPTTSYVLGVVFVLYISLQFPIAIWCAIKLDEVAFFRKTRLSLPIAWTAIEMLYPNVFPWAYGYSQTAWTSFSVLGQIGGAPLLSFLLLFFCEHLYATIALFYRTFSGRNAACHSDALHLPPQNRMHTRLAYLHLPPLLLLPLLLIYGHHLANATREQMLASPKLKVGLIQGNLTTVSKGDPRVLDANIRTYLELSKRAVASGADVIIWSESVVIEWLHLQNFNTFKNSRFDFTSNLQRPVIFGGLTSSTEHNIDYATEQLQQNAHENATTASVAITAANAKRLGPQVAPTVNHYNSAIVQSIDGQLYDIYHKQKLFPFGEYIPFENLFPFLRLWSPKSGKFTPGSKPPVLNVPLSDGRIVRVAPAICYEDFDLALARLSAQNGAQIMMTFTNDAWYGKTLAPYLHNFLAAWRAIENNRYLVRTTNTGQTTVINPLGEIEGELPIFEQDFLVREVALLSNNTVYTRVGNYPAYTILVLVALYWGIAKRCCKR